VKKQARPNNLCEYVIKRANKYWRKPQIDKKAVILYNFRQQRGTDATTIVFLLHKKMFGGKEL
jgi:hypothetical protein